MATKGPADEQDGERRTTVYVRGPGIAYVHTRELMQSPKVQRLYREISEIVREEKRRRREQEEQRLTLPLCCRLHSEAFGGQKS